MNKYLKLFITAFMSVLSLLAYGDEVSSREWFNPENTWEYMRVDQSSPSEYDPLQQDISVIPYLMNYSGSETIDGKEYIRYDWKWKPEITHLFPLNSHYLLREEDGAIYVYIGESEDPSYWGSAAVEPGEYLLYDFNMEEGTEYMAPFAEYLNHDDGLALQSNLCLMGKFRVSSKSVDDEGRRVMLLDPIKDNNETDYLLRPITIVEGVGPITSQSNVGAFYFPRIPLSVDPPASFEFYGMFSPDGEEVYIIPAERESGFRKEKDYQWIYGVYDSNGKVKYIKTEFNYYADYGEHFYRRFIILQVSENPEGEWQASHDPDRYLLREEDGKVYLRHSEGSTTTLEDGKPMFESLIYDFNSGDTSQLKVYTTEGEQEFSISTSLTDVGGEEMRSYSFDSSNGVKCVEGIGVVQGGILPCVNSSFRLPHHKDDNSSYCGAVLVAVYDGEGKLLFSQDMPSGISKISKSNGLDALPGRIYDLQGRELTAPVPGQPYIKEGKILIGK